MRICRARNRGYDNHVVNCTVEQFFKYVTKLISDIFVFKLFYEIRISEKERGEGREISHTNQASHNIFVKYSVYESRSSKNAFTMY